MHNSIEHFDGALKEVLNKYIRVYGFNILAANSEVRNSLARETCILLGKKSIRILIRKSSTDKNVMCYFKDVQEGPYA